MPSAGLPRASSAHGNILTPEPLPPTPRRIDLASAFSTADIRCTRESKDNPRLSSCGVSFFFHYNNNSDNMRIAMGDKRTLNKQIADMETPVPLFGQFLKTKSSIKPIYNKSFGTKSKATLSKCKSDDYHVVDKSTKYELKESSKKDTEKV